MKATAILINSARGPVIEEQGFIGRHRKTQRKVVLDVFEHEPVISEQVLKAVSLVTPHIAGYSLEGKARGTQMIYDAFVKPFSLKQIKDSSHSYLCAQYFEGQDLKSALQKHLNEIYPIGTR